MTRVTMFEKLEEEIEVKADEYALEESTACNYGESSKHVYQGYFYGFKKGAEFGYNKANEWHYVKDGDLPKEEGTYLVYISGNLLVDRWHNGKWMLHFNTDAWKEIVLPKEIKENEN